MSSWIDQELAGYSFADERLGKRCAVLMEQLSSGLGRTIPLACGDWAATKAAYRFLDNDRVGEADILAGHFAATRERFGAVDGPVLVLHDTTEFSFTRENAEAVGLTHKVAKGHKDGRGQQRMHTVCGILMHSSLTGSAAQGPTALPGRRVDGFDNLSIFAKAAAPRFGFTGAEFDVETGLYHMGARYYDPTMGRFVSQDPAPPSSADASNLYRYAWNDPIDMSDPTGFGAFATAASAVGRGVGSFASAIGGRGSAGTPASAFSLSYAPGNGSGFAMNVNWSDNAMAGLVGNVPSGSDLYGPSDTSPDAIIYNVAKAQRRCDDSNATWAQRNGIDLAAATGDRASIFTSGINGVIDRDFESLVRHQGSLEGRQRLSSVIMAIAAHDSAANTHAAMMGTYGQALAGEAQASTFINRADRFIGGLGSAEGLARGFSSVPEHLLSGFVSGATFGFGSYTPRGDYGQGSWQTVLGGVAEFVGEVAGGAATGAVIGRIVQGVRGSGISSVEAFEANLVRNPNCFLPGTDMREGDGDHEDIEDIHVGDRVATDGGVANSVDGQTRAFDVNATSVDRKTWRKLTIHAINRWSDGTQDEWNVETLRPLTSLLSEGTVIGGSIDLDGVLDLKEMGVPDGLVGTIASIDACPKIERGDGRVVTTTVNHLNANVYTLTIRNKDGKLDTLGVTGSHRFYDEADGWQQTAQLTVGNHLRTNAGDVEVLGVEHMNGTRRVYNMTVESDHVYYVGGLDTLTHNNCGQFRTTSPAEVERIRRKFDATARGTFFRDFSATPGAQSAFSARQIARMQRGLSPDASQWIVHHKQPLFRGGDNSYDNLLLLPRGFHNKNFSALHYYESGMNPFGRN